MNQYDINSIENYQSTKELAVTHPENFWGDIARDYFIWEKPFSRVLEYDLYEPSVSWFADGMLNITENCLDRHLKTHAEKTAILFEPNNPKEKAQKISYKDLYENVCKVANVLKEKGIKKGDRVCLYMPMVPDLAYAMLACARIGAIHSIVFAGFSSSALASRINDSGAKMLITADGAYRGEKILNLKKIVDEALTQCPAIENVLVSKRTGEDVEMKENRDEWLHNLTEKALPVCPVEIMNAEDPLFILYTSGSTGKPKGMLHTIAGYMVYTAYTFKNVFQYKPGDIYFCTADIGWITGHSYIIYGPLANGATTVMFEGIPSYPDYGRFWSIIEKHHITHFYTAPTAIRSLAKQSLDYVTPYKLNSLKVLGTVGEPINEEAWEWYHHNIGKGRCPIIDTWWQTETGGMMITGLAGITAEKPTYATLPLPGIQACLMDEHGKEIETQQAEGNLCIKFPWPSMARTIWKDHQRYKETYFTAYPGKYFTGDGALRDAAGNYRITGRVDDVIIVSGHNLGTAPIEDAIDEHECVSEAAIVGFPHDIKGNALYGYVCLKSGNPDDSMRKQINEIISQRIGAIAKLDKIQFVNSLPKTRSGKIMRRILRKIACHETEDLGDTSTLLNPECVEEIISGAKNM